METNFKFEITIRRIDSCLKPYLASSVLLVASAFALWGCSKASTNPMNSPQSASAENHSHDGHEHGDHVEGDNAEIVAALAKLPGRRSGARRKTEDLSRLRRAARCNGCSDKGRCERSASLHLL